MGSSSPPSAARSANWKSTWVSSCSNAGHSRSPQPVKNCSGSSQPFFSNLNLIAGELQGGEPRQIRIGASTIVLRDHLPEFFRNVTEKVSAVENRFAGRISRRIGRVYYSGRNWIWQ